MKQVTFGEWLRWTIARQNKSRAELARELIVSAKTVTNLYRKATPAGISDPILSRLAALLEMSEPELLVKWQDGLPDKPALAGTAKPTQRKTSTRRKR